MSPDFQGEVWTGDAGLRVTGILMIFKIMRVDEIHQREHVNKQSNGAHVMILIMTSRCMATGEKEQPQ